MECVKSLRIYLLTIKDRKEVNMNKTKYVERARSAINGQYVTMEYAAKHPRTTVIEKDKIKK